MIRTLLPLVLLGSGCTVEVPGWPIPPGLDGMLRPDAAPAPTDLVADVVAAPAGELSTQKPVSCPALEGAWSGSCGGKVTGAYTVEVTGTIALTLKPGAKPGDYLVSAGEWSSAPKTMPSLVTKQPLTGTVRCGVFETTAEVSILGVKSIGKVACVFDVGGCKGSWTGKAVSGSSQGSGTFELHRK